MQSFLALELLASVAVDERLRRARQEALAAGAAHLVPNTRAWLAPLAGTRLRLAQALRHLAIRLDPQLATCEPGQLATVLQR